MKTRLLSLLSCAAIGVTLSQCVVPANNDGSASAPSGSASGDGTIKPGMTKAQVVAVWGEPDEKKPTSSGELWRWSQQGWKRHVPVYGTWARVEEHVVRFGPDGKVIGAGTEDYGNAFQEGWRRTYGTN
ncbi:MAG: hypothetical protein U1F71_21675 [Verrucomicrobiaceae bacterium]